MSGDTIYAASSGGLQIHNVKSGSVELISNSKIFPDPHLTALCRDARGNLWIGSQKGYLYKRTPRGQFRVFSNYKLADWGILCLYTHGDLIVVGSNRGVSLFDPQRGIALRNSANIADFSNPRVNSITVFKDTLFLGCEEGVAFIDSLDIVPLRQRNFYYSGIWKTKETDEPVVSFINTGNSILPQAAPSALFRGRLFTAIDSIRYNDQNQIAYRGVWLANNGSPQIEITHHGKVTELRNEGDRRLWIGTDDMYYFSFNGDDDPQQHKIEGLSLRRGTRVTVAPNGNVWVLPVVRFEGVLCPSWHYGIYRYDGQRWHSYNCHSHGEAFGYIGDGSALGAAIGPDGALWAGTWGGNIKHIDPVKNTVGQLFVGFGDYRDIHYSAHGGFTWGKVDALASDSSGFLWISVFDHNLGSLICYNPRFHPNSAETDPVKAHYRHFFTEYPLKTMNISELNVDAQNRIFAFDETQSRLTVFKHNGNPLADSIEVISDYPHIGMVSSIKSAVDGTTYISATTGLRRIRAGETRLETVDSTLSNITSIAVQGEVLWLGTRTNGILRYNTVDSSKIWINEDNGLLSNDVRSLAIDTRQGRLWIVTESGVVQLDVGRESKISSSEPVFVFPNVFSISRKNQGVDEVTFARLEPRSVVSIYAVNGVLVDKINAQRDPVTPHEWRARWRPKRSLAPGTYFAVVKPSGKRVKVILMP
ncbi:MAG: hypothetical protein FWE57_11360 [Chitinispirillia bacterium]|nr:hypothetical protein [Chitinispirillia bacterium]